MKLHITIDNNIHINIPQNNIFESISDSIDNIVIDPISDPIDNIVVDPVSIDSLSFIEFNLFTHSSLFLTSFCFLISCTIL